LSKKKSRALSLDKGTGLQEYACFFFLRKSGVCMITEGLRAKGIYVGKKGKGKQTHVLLDK
jgi:hypothetical protein